MKTIYLIDGTAFIFRAFHAIRNLSNSKGFPTNAAFGFTRMLIKLMEDKKPEFVCVMFDTKGPNFRHEMYSMYKANRPPAPEELNIQVPYIKDITRAFNLKMIEMDGFEADDIIGTIAGRAEENGFNVVIVSGDKDFIQLVTKNTSIWDPMKEKTTDLDSVQNDFGLEPGRMIEVMGLSGDTADNVPGVPGIGPKTALSLIKTFGTMDNLYENVDTITKKKQHENLVKYREQAFLSRKLVTIDTSVPIPFNPEDFRVVKQDNAKLSSLYKELEFRKLQKEVKPASDLSQKDYQAVSDSGRLENLARDLEDAGLFALDTETSSINPMEAKLVGISLSYGPDRAFYLPIGHEGPEWEIQLDISRVKEILGPVLADPKIKKIGQNIKYDWIVLSRHGFDLKGVVFDTMIASYLINPSKRVHSLDQIALDYLGHRMISFEEAAGKGRQVQGFVNVPPEKAVPYACEDADITLLAYKALVPVIEEMSLSDLMAKVEMPLLPVLMKMETMGISIDREKLGLLSMAWGDKLVEIEKDIYALAGEEFNIKSSQQLGVILFDKLGLPVKKKTKKTKGYSTDVEVLTSLSTQHELPALILRHRTLSKLKSTYADALVDLVNPETSRIHTSFNQTVTATGRLSSSRPNLQNIPIRDQEGLEIRRAFVPRQGWKLVSADYSQIELRILAHCSEDAILIDAFKKGEDIHTRTASEVFQLLPSFITPEVRRQAKAINFGIIYGMSPYGLSKNLGISQKMAKTYIEEYFARYRGVKSFIDMTIEETRKGLQTSTILGRIRRLPDITSSNRNLSTMAERIAVNTPIQGSAADLIKLAMIQVDAAFAEKNFESSMLLSVHDELIFEVKPEELEEVMEVVKKIMENVWDLKVPLKVNMDWGENWAEAH